MEIEYIGEHLFIGNLGNFFIVAAFVSSLLAFYSYFVASNNKEEEISWRNLGRWAFRAHSFSVAGIIGTMFYMLVNHYFEYHYVWQHSNTEMPMRYILSCFWEGQEGSFLLWTFWHVIIGNILIYSAKSFESPVMAVMSSVQAFLSSMLLGVIILGYKVGSNPFLLLRDNPEFVDLPFLQNPNYLSKLDGRGLNPLLQNYWMTIHPPTLFLGFASTVVPFCYAMAGLWQKRYTEWLKPALPWTFFGVMILGTGILMGGAWAYEALSFGGFWAWDPVENASLVPWLTFVGAAHVMVIQKNKGQSLIMTFVLTFLTFILILYSTFLTRSGILGDTSVHAFTDLGMSGQLLIYLLFYLFISIALIAINWKSLPHEKEEDSIWSREFWMFIGALVLGVSAFQIFFTTSIPVINKVLGTNIAPPLDPIDHYNSWQLPIAIIVALLIAVGQYFKYKNTEPRKLIEKLAASIIISVVLTVLLAWGLEMYNLHFSILLFASVFAIVANLNYLIVVLKGKVKLSGASIAHVGFAMILLGALISMSKSNVISMNTSGVNLENLGKDFKNHDNIMLMKNDTLRMGEYFVTYKGKKKEGINIFYEIEYFTRNEKGDLHKDFTLFPVVQTNPRMGNVAEPATQHFLHKDIYTHVTYAELENEDAKQDPNEYKQSKTVTVAPGDTIFGSNSIVVFEGFDKEVNKLENNLTEKDIAVGISLTAKDITGKSFKAQPLYIIREVYVVPHEAEIPDLGMKFKVNKIIPESGKVEISVLEKKSNFREFIILKAIIFPYINILWSGCILLVIGTILAIRHRLKQI